MWQWGEKHFCNNRIVVWATAARGRNCAINFSFSEQQRAAAANSGDSARKVAYRAEADHGAQTTLSAGAQHSSVSRPQETDWHIFSLNLRL